jgi:hypothetical protein
LGGFFFEASSMLKRFFLTLALMIGLVTPSFSAGTIPLSLTQRFDKITFKPLSGGKLYFIKAGTTSTPQNAFQDINLTIPWPNYLTLDAGGNIPQLFFADGLIKVRLTNSKGVVQFETDNIQVIGASSGGSTPPSVDATTVLATGDLKARYGTGDLSGFVRANGRTIGSASSGASERANADCQPLFEYLWTVDSSLVVSTGRGASANADWVANKTIALPDWRGRALAALDNMGNSASGRLTATYFGTAATALGAASTFTDSRTLLTANLPPYTPAGSVSVVSQNPLTKNASLGINPGAASATAVWFGGSSTVETSTGTLTGTAQGGSSTPFSAIPPTMLATFYIKL